MTMPALIRRVLVSAYRGAAQILGGTGISQVFPFAPINRVLCSWMRTKSVNLDGHLIYLDPNDSMNLSICGVHEPFEIQVLRDIVKPGFVAADVGANIGFYTLLFARAVGPQGAVHAFEPEPSNAALLKRNVAVNGYGNVVVNQSAVSNSSGAMCLYLAEDNAVDHRLSDASGNRERLEIATVRLDDYFADLDRAPDIIKMDIQGAEGRVVETLDPLLERNPGLILVMEFWPYGLSSDGTDPEKLLATLAQLGFQVEELDEGRSELNLVSPADLLKRFTPENQRHTNLLCRRK